MQPLSGHKFPFGKYTVLTDAVIDYKAKGKTEKKKKR